MGLYIDWNDIVSRYPSIAGVGGAEEVSSAHIIYAENELNGRLSPKYTVPFSSNNMTAKDLSIEISYVRIGNINTDQRSELIESIDKRIERLLSGDEDMMDDTGEIVQISVGGTIWSSTMNYTPTFGSGDIEDFVVDPDLISDEDSARG